MSNKDKKYWFSAIRGQTGIVDYVICAHTRDESKEYMGSLVEGYCFSQLTWSMVSELTGCLIPSFVDRSDFATGPLLFCRNNGCFSIGAF